MEGWEGTRRMKMKAGREAEVVGEETKLGEWEVVGCGRARERERERERKREGGKESGTGCV